MVARVAGRALPDIAAADDDGQLSGCSGAAGVGARVDLDRCRRDTLLSRRTRDLPRDSTSPTARAAGTRYVLARSAAAWRRLAPDLADRFRRGGARSRGMDSLCNRGGGYRRLPRVRFAR